MRDLLHYFAGFELRRLLGSAFGACVLLWIWYCVGMAEPPRWGLLIFGLVLALAAYVILLGFIRKIDDRDTI
jgi:hypothetical protein